MTVRLMMIPIPDLERDLVGAKRVIDQNFHSLRDALERAISNGTILNPDTKALVGDVEGSIGTDGDTTVVAIQGIEVTEPTAGDDGKVLAYDHAGGEFDWVDCIRDVLTTQGDLLFRGASVEERLPIGALDEILLSDGLEPLWASLSFLLDSLGGTRGDMLRRGAVDWEAFGLGTSGQYITSDGTDPVWGDPPASAAHNLLSSTHGDTTPGAVVQGDVIIGDATPKWVRLPVGANNEVLTTDGTDVFWAAPGSGGSPHNLLSATHSDTTAASAVVGDLITGQTGPVWARLAKGLNDEILRSDGTDVLWMDPKHHYFMLGYSMYAFGILPGANAAIVDRGYRLVTRSAASVQDAADSEKWAQQLNGTTTGIVGLRTNAGGAEIQSRHYPFLRCDMKIVDNDDGCLWIGFSNQLNMVNTADPGQQTAALRFRNGTDTTWKFITRDAGGTVNTIDTTIAPGATWHEYEVYTDDGGVTFKAKIDGVIRANTTANVPTSSQTMTAFAQQIAISSSNRTIQMSGFSVQLNKRPVNF